MVDPNTIRKDGTDLDSELERLDRLAAAGKNSEAQTIISHEGLATNQQGDDGTDELLSVATAATGSVDPVSSDFGEVEPAPPVPSTGASGRHDADELFAAAGGSIEHDLPSPDIDLEDSDTIPDEDKTLDNMAVVSGSDAMPPDTMPPDAMQPDAMPLDAMQLDGDDGLHDLKNLQDTIEELSQELVSLRKKSDDYREAALQVRTEAEAEKQRLQRELEKRLAYALEKSLHDLLPILDSLEFGLQAADAGAGVDPVALREGLVLTLGLFGKFLDNAKVVAISPAGMKFDPELHEAVSVQPVAGVNKDQIVTVVQKGYVLNGRLLRPAKVIVSG